MKVWVVMIADRHTDTDAEVFLDPDQAIDYARRTAHLLASYNPGSVVDEFPATEAETWLYHAHYSEEGDCVWVIEKEVHE